MMRTLLLLGLAVTAGCTDVSGIADDNVERQVSLWNKNGFAKYSALQARLCVCAENERRVRIEVVNEVVTKATYEDDGTPLSPTQRAQIKSVNQLFDFIRAARAAKPVQFRSEYDPELGYPTLVQVDPSGEVANDQNGYALSQVTKIP